MRISSPGICGPRMTRKFLSRASVSDGSAAAAVNAVQMRTISVVKGRSDFMRSVWGGNIFSSGSHSERSAAESKNPAALSAMIAGYATGFFDCVLPLARDHSAQNDPRNGKSLVLLFLRPVFRAADVGFVLRRQEF